MNNLHNRIILRHIERRIEHNKNVLIVTVGGTGSGKSYAALRLMEKLNKKSSYYVFTTPAFMQLLDSKPPKNTCIMLDEAGVAAGARNWQSTFNKTMSHVAQTFRHQNYIVNFTVPDLSMVDVHLRKLMHYLIETHSIDYDRKISTVKIKRIQYNKKLGKIYYKCIPTCLDGDYKKLTLLKLKMPRPKTIEKYEADKQKYLSELNKKMLEDVNIAFNGKKTEIKAIRTASCEKCGYSWEAQVKTPKKCPNCSARKYISVEETTPTNNALSSNLEFKHEMAKI